ncbi:WYL domain-containing protein, partial [Flavobacterium sp.]|uniref:WYL domain-containing protein n=1 Tax=Flavobacterium sp. TaxID=239 RepID=UPI0025BB1234
AEESIRTVSNVQLAINALTNEHIENYRLNNNYLTAYCHKRDDKRTFKFDRIGEIEILDI